MVKNKSSQMIKDSMLTYKRGFIGKKPPKTNFREIDENICSPSNDITPSASGGSLGKCDNKGQRKENCCDLEAKMIELQKENLKLSRELKSHADYCMLLKRENKFLLDDLKDICEPNIIAFLEARNPDQSPESVDSQSDSQGTESMKEINSSSENSADAINSNLNVETNCQ